ncbi:tripartite tricarboxylate transporter permease [Paenibacillus naphthalenovorans]|uniref:tripartite tricarboxylate transporter permease n=1 Tax=Paenibacillus naphthalenovorans TaxID=162209 RepID=UPI003D2E13BD
MDTFQQLLHGFQIATSWESLLYVWIGVSVGTLIGMLPGLGPITAISVMIPVSYGMNPTLALIMMAGVYYGAMYGGSTTSILINTPGESSSVVTTLDGYQLAKQGKAGKALAVAAIGSFAGGTISVVLLMLFAPYLAEIALSFGPPEYFSLVFLGLITVSSLFDGSKIKAMISVVAGFMVATVGIDAQTGTPRFTFDSVFLLEGFDFLIIALGLFALAEVSSLIIHRNEALHDRKAIGSLLLSKKEIKEITGPTLRQSFFGFVIGVLPGAGASISSFLAYITEKRLSKNPAAFGKGSLVGVAAPETSNNAASGGAFVPLLSLGIPGSGTTAVLLGAFLVMGIQPGPLLFQDHPDIFWGVIASMYVGNIFLLILNLPLIPYISRLMYIPRAMLIPLIITFCFIGVYVIGSNVFDLYMLVLFGMIGYFMYLYSFPAAPFILSFILGEMMEQSFRQSMTASNGSLMIFIDRPISLSLLILTVIILVFPMAKKLLLKRR